jgi:hypothetical protein
MNSLTFELPDSDSRMKEIILYIARICEGDKTYGAIKLNKILFFSDMLTYARTGKPLTGAAYMKERLGPVPKRLLPVRCELIDAGDAAIERRLYYNVTQQRLRALREARLDAFTGQEIAIVNEVIKNLKSFDGSGVTKLSHTIAWDLVEEHQPIPYESVFLAEPTVDSDDTRRAKELATQHRWDV